MRVDYAKYPQIPPGCMLNPDPKGTRFQVYRERRITDPETGKRKSERESVGVIKDEKFYFSPLFEEKERSRQLAEKLAEAKEQINRLTNGIIDRGEKVSARVQSTHSAVSNLAIQSSVDGRQPKKVSYSFCHLAFGSLLASLSGTTDAVGIANYIQSKHHFFKAYLKDFDLANLNSATVRRSLMLTDSDSFRTFYAALVAPLIKHTKNRVIAADGQAVRATGKKVASDKSGIRMLMNVYDATNRVTLTHELIDRKENEITVGPDLLRSVDIAGATITADAMSCQLSFVDAVLEGGANYLLSLKGNQSKTADEVRYLFKAGAHASHITSFQFPIELDHGRIETRTAHMIPAKFLSKELLDKWQGLSDGTLLMIQLDRFEKSTKKSSFDERFFITSLAPEENRIEEMAQAVRTHWAIENNLHWRLDLQWSQDRMQAKDPNYIANRSLLNKFAVATLQNYRVWLWEKGRIKEINEISLNCLKQRCSDPEVAVEALAAALGLI